MQIPVVTSSKIARRFSCLKVVRATTSGLAVAKLSSLRGVSTTSLPPVAEGAHRVVLMRHGESEFNNANLFTGWCDVALTQRGIVEAVEAGQVFASHNLRFRKCYSSILTRAIVTAQRSLEAAEVSYTPIVYDWRLNERHYGALQGLGKDRTADRLGRARVMEWRRSFRARPPLMKEGHPHYNIIYNDARYKQLPHGVTLPLGESLEDCQKRVVLAWNDIAKDLSAPAGNGKQFTCLEGANYSLIVAHANSIRALVMHLDNIDSTEIEGINIPTAIPIYYDICLETGKVIPAESGIVQDGKFRGVFMSDDRKKRNFLERRRMANDPFVWALHDEQVASSMLTVGVVDDKQDTSFVSQKAPEGLKGIEDEAKRNTELLSSVLRGAE